MSQGKRRFMTWKDLVVTPLVESFICAAGVALTWLLHRVHPLGWLEAAVAFMAFQTGVTLLVLKVLRTFAPLRPGVYRGASDQRYLYNLVGFLQTLNLAAVQHSELLPVFFRQFWYRLVGAQIGKGIVMISGEITDPSLVTIGDGVFLGRHSLLLSHALGASSTEDDFLLLARIEIGDGALVGAASIIMPGARIGEHAMINAMSFVPTNVHVPPYEIWGGIPAKKVGEVRRVEEVLPLRNSDSVKAS